MKKSIILVVFILIAIVILPIVGNSVMKEEIDNRLVELKAFGLQSQKDEETSSYLNTSRHFEFILKDAKKFITYINQYSDQQIPPYVDAMLEGAVIGADIEYSNLPFAKALTVEIYPLTMSLSMQESLKVDNLDFYKYVKAFLNSKGVLYHIDYNLLNEDFKGYIKDIDESFTTEDKTELKLKIKDALFDGNGKLIAPNRISSKLKELNFSILDEKLNATFTLSKLSSSSTFESKTTYLSSADVKEFEVKITGTEDDFNLSAKNIRINASSNTQGEKAEINSKSSIKEISLNSKTLTFDMKEFNFDIALSEIDKKSFEEFRVISASSDISTSPASLDMEEKLRNALIRLVSKGLVLNVADFSLKNITIDKKEDLKGFVFKSNIRVKEDAILVQKMKMSPLLAITNLELVSNIKLSDEIYLKLTEANPMTSIVEKYAKREKGNVLFDINFVDGKVTVNGTPLQ